MADARSLPIIAYVVGCGHSGTTLLQRLLNAHPRAVSIGGVRYLRKGLQGLRHCSCGADDLDRCDLWAGVDARLRERGRELAELNPKSRDPEEFRAHNLLLFEAIAESTGAQVIVDPARQLDRLRQLGRIDALDVRPIHIFKDPRAQSASAKRKKGHALRVMGTYVRTNSQSLRVARRLPTRLHLSYERLCDEPGTSLTELLGYLGLDPDPTILDSWASVPVHALEGNRMLRSDSSAIVRDESWRTRLTPGERAFASVVGYPTHAACKQAERTSRRDLTIVARR